MHSYKLRDAIISDNVKRSFFYQFIFKTITTIYTQYDEEATMRLLNVTKNELTQMINAEKKETILSTYDMESYAKVKVCQ